MRLVPYSYRRSHGTGKQDYAARGIESSHHTSILHPDLKPFSRAATSDVMSGASCLTCKAGQTLEDEIRELIIELDTAEAEADE